MGIFRRTPSTALARSLAPPTTCVRPVRGDRNLNLGSATFYCGCNLSPVYSPILPFVIRRNVCTSRQRRRQRRSPSRDPPSFDGRRKSRRLSNRHLPVSDARRAIKMYARITSRLRAATAKRKTNAGISRVYAVRMIARGWKRDREIDKLCSSRRILKTDS